MKNIAGEKVKRIIEEEFDNRVAMMVIQYVLYEGIDNLKELTEEDILKIKGNAMMTDRFVQSMVRAGVRIAKECDMYNDFLPYIINHLYVPAAVTKEIVLYKDDLYDWEFFVDHFDIEYENKPSEVSMIVLNANVLDVEYKED